MRWPGLFAYIHIDNEELVICKQTNVSMVLKIINNQIILLKSELENIGTNKIPVGVTPLAPFT